MIPVVILVARLFSVPTPWVARVADAAQVAGNDAALSVSRVEWECHFVPTAERFNDWDGSTDWGWAQFNSRYHDQHRDDLRAHVVAMERFQAQCNRRAAGEPRLGLAIYHRWTPDASGLAYADAVLAIAEIVRAQGRIETRRRGGAVISDAAPQSQYSTTRGGRRDKAPGQARREPEAAEAILPGRSAWHAVCADRLFRGCGGMVDAGKAQKANSSNRGIDSKAVVSRKTYTVQVRLLSSPSSRRGARIHVGLNCLKRPATCLEVQRRLNRQGSTRVAVTARRDGQHFERKEGMTT